MKDSADVYDVIVVGAGVEGSATAYHLAKMGKRALLLEQFPLPHGRGSSHGHSRITRKAYGAQDYYTNMMHESFRLTDELQAECQQQLFINCGCLILGTKDDKFVSDTTECLQKYNMPHKSFGPAVVGKKYPFLRFSDNYHYVLDGSGGILRADRVLTAFQNQFVRYGGRLQDGEPMLDIYPGDIVSVKTTKGVYRCRSLVLAVGPWAAKVLPRLGVQAPLKPIRTTACYWRENTPGQLSHENFPPFIDRASFIYGLPSVEYPGLVKICLHNGPDVDADQRDKVDNSWVIDRVTSYVAQHFPTLHHKPSIVESCIYTNTPDDNPIIDVHPAWRNIVFGAGFCGHGFKLAPVVGKVLAQLALGETPEYDMAPFKLDRFHKSKI